MELSGTMIDGTAILYQESAWTGKKKLTVNGTCAVKVGKKLFRSEQNGATVDYTVKGNFLLGVTVEANNGQTVLLAKNTWYDWIMIFLPILGVGVGVFGGAIGGGLSALFCILGALINANLSRSKLPLPLRIVLQVVVAVVVNAIWFALYFVCAMLILKVALFA